MAIDKIKLENFTVFENIEIEFNKGINVFIGENGTGKTHLLKVLYAFCETEAPIKPNNEGTFDVTSLAHAFINELPKLFLCSQSNLYNDIKKSIKGKISYSKLNFDIETKILDFDDKTDQFTINVTENITEYISKLKYVSVFIPAIEMLIYSTGFLAMYDKFKMPFDKTQKDIIVNAQIPDTRELSEMAKKIIGLTEGIIDGKVIYENDTFFVIKNDGRKVPFSLESEGFRKFGLIQQLLKNGSIEEGSILFWDEPEANINPKHIPVLVDILLELERNGVQIFLATHDDFLAKYLQVKRDNIEEVTFHSLYKDNNNCVKCETDSRFETLEHNTIIKQSIQLYKDEVKKVMD